MTLKKRPDGRKFDQTRKVEAKAGVIKNADGSGFFKIGNTSAYAAVYGPKELFPRNKQDPKKGLLRCNYNMMPFSGAGDRVRPGPSRRSKEISMVTQKALLPVVDLSNCPNAVVDVFIELTETDAGSRCAGICAASIALADAGITMKDMVSAVSAGIVDNQVLVDLDYQEEAYETGDVADIPVAMIPNTEEITLLQMDGRISKEDFKKALEMVKQPLKDLAEIQRKALKEKYK
ncbi:exosome complex exonuclease Rrp41 [archaeon]|nr:exosome complex exonuclease Rrp41 [archaeon]MBL7056995.1 exosome complex exonuclease Rrp41 [Candidatus Woesearchaeota archaeon]